jgi:5-enolpyruvylshikimate-3-phosphate synthase
VLVLCDELILHRSRLILGRLTVGKIQINALLDSKNILATMQAIRQLGASVTHGENRAALGMYMMVSVLVD